MDTDNTKPARGKKAGLWLLKYSTPLGIIIDAAKSWSILRVSPAGLTDKTEDELNQLYKQNIAGVLTAIVTALMGVVFLAIGGNTFSLDMSEMTFTSVIGLVLFAYAGYRGFIHCGNMRILSSIKELPTESTRSSEAASYVASEDAEIYYTRCLALYWTFIAFLFFAIIKVLLPSNIGALFNDGASLASMVQSLIGLGAIAFISLRAYMFKRDLNALEHNNIRLTRMGNEAIAFGLHPLIHHIALLGLFIYMTPLISEQLARQGQLYVTLVPVAFLAVLMIGAWRTYNYYTCWISPNLPSEGQSVLGLLGPGVLLPIPPKNKPIPSPLTAQIAGLVALVLALQPTEGWATLLASGSLLLMSGLCFCIAGIRDKLRTE